MRFIKAALKLIHDIVGAVAIGLIIGGIIEVWRAGLIDSAVVMALLLICVVHQNMTINSVKRDLERAASQPQGVPKP